MIKNDYILRMIEQLSIVIAEIIGLRTSKKFAESQQIVNDACHKYLGISLQSVNILSLQDLISIISGRDGIDPGKGLALAELLKQQADLYAAQNDYDQAVAMNVKSLDVFIVLLTAHPDLAVEPYIAEIDEIIVSLKPYKLLEDSQYAVFQFYELIGRYDQAENILWELLEGKGFADDMVDKGIAFYERLRVQNQAEFVPGNLPLDEIMDELNRLYEYKK